MSKSHFAPKNTVGVKLVSIVEIQNKTKETGISVVTIMFQIGSFNQMKCREKQFYIPNHTYIADHL